MKNKNKLVFDQNQYKTQQSFTPAGSEEQDKSLASSSEEIARSSAGTGQNSSTPKRKATSPQQNSASPYLRAANEDDDGYDPYSDRPAPQPSLFEADPWR